MEQNNKKTDPIEELQNIYLEKISQTFLIETTDSFFNVPYTKAYSLTELLPVLIERLFPKAYAKFFVMLIFHRVRRKTIKYYFLARFGKRACPIHDVYHATNNVLKAFEAGTQLPAKQVAQLLKLRDSLHSKNSMNA